MRLVLKVKTQEGMVRSGRTVMTCKAERMRQSSTAFAIVL